MTQYSWQNKVAELQKKGELARACAVLVSALNDTRDDAEVREILHLLMKFNVEQSRPGQAHRHALQFEARFGFRHVPWWAALLGIYVFCGFYLLRGALLGGRLSGALASVFARWTSPKMAESEVPWPHLVSLIYANYWNNIRKCATYSFMQLHHAKSRDQALLAIGLLGYTAAYAGHTVIGTRTLKKVIEESERRGSKDLVRTLYTHLGIAYQMGACVKESLAVYDHFEKTVQDVPTFFSLLCHVNRITLHLSEGDIDKANESIERCFGFSFALKDSRNHIQIYGSKAILLAIEGHAEKAISFLKKSQQAAEASDNALDWIIFSRYAAIAYLELGNLQEANVALRIGRKSARQYGYPGWYTQELDRIEAVMRGAGKSPARRVAEAARFLTRSLRRLNISLGAKGLRLTPEILLAPVPSYFSRRRLLSFLYTQVKKSNRESDHALLFNISDRLASVLLDNSFIEQMDRLSVEHLERQIQHAFTPRRIYVGTDTTDLMEQLRAEGVVSGFNIFNDAGDRLKVPCTENTFFLGMKAPSTREYTEPLSIGIRLDKLDVGVEPLVEAGLQIILTNFVFVQSLRVSRERYVRDQQEMAVARVASQVAHDIRSPLTALDMVLSLGLSEMGEERRVLVREALGRINDIANNLLKIDRDRQSLENGADKVESVLLGSLLGSLVTEKRLQYRSRLEVQIEAAGSGKTYGLFCAVNPAELKRVLSNIIDNAVQAIPTRGRVEIDAGVEGEFGFLRISDNGTGIPKEVLARLGERGFSYQKTNGTGLGLWHAKTTVMQWGGRLEVQSTVGEGTVVTVYLPRVEAPSWFLPSLTLNPGAKVMVIDDDLSVHEVWRERLRSVGAFDENVLLSDYSSPREFLEAANGATAEDEVMYLIDFEYLNDEMNGLDLCRKLAKPGRCVLVTSRYEQSDVLSQVETLGLKMLPKPLAAHVPIEVGCQSTFQP